MFEPSVVASSKAVHRAVQVDSRNSLMGLDDAIQDGRVFYVSCTLVVDDDIVIFGPIELSVQGQDGGGGAIVGPVDVDLDIGSGLNTFANGLLLFCVIVTAATRNEQSTNGLTFGFLAECGCGYRTRKNDKGSEQ